MSRLQNSEQNQNIKISNRSFENAAKLKYLGAAVSNQNLIHEEIKSRLYSDISCYNSVQKGFVFSPAV
jgi:hypothetical protein